MGLEEVFFINYYNKCNQHKTKYELNVKVNDFMVNKIDDTYTALEEKI